ncbi:MAG: universal stress protein [Deltaproteobacteria bacterium]|nr:universal stress protein [Deltaproteobacteria bacterium]
MKYSKVLIPLDGSQLAEKAIEAALPVAKAFRAPIVLLGVLDLTAGMYDVYSEAFSPVDLRTQLEGFLQAALDRAAARVRAEGIEVTSLLRMGIPHEEIVGLAEEEKVDLIVMTTHARRGLTHLLLGSVTEKVVRSANCAVLVVRAEPRTS